MAGSPFPGMDPYLERYWRDVHSRLVVYICDSLQESLPPPLRARVEERVFVEDPSAFETAFTQRSVEIVDGRGGQVVTAIEVVSVRAGPARNPRRRRDTPPPA